MVPGQYLPSGYATGLTGRADLDCLLTCALSGSLWADTPSYRNVLYQQGAQQITCTFPIIFTAEVALLCCRITNCFYTLSVYSTEISLG